MSHANYGSTARDEIPSSSGLNRVEFNQLSDSISANIFTINSGATALDHIYKQIGTAKDTVSLHDRLHVTQQSTNAVVIATVKQVRQFSILAKKGEKAQKLQDERLRAELQDSVKRYTDWQKKIANKITTTTSFKPVPQSNWDDGAVSDKTSLMEKEAEQKMAQKQLDQEIEFEQALFIEREQMIQQIETDMLDVNQIFKELGSMVHEQGEILNTIEANVESTHYEVNAGRQQLSKASEYQQKYRKKLCCFVVIIAVTAVVVAVIVILSTKK